MRVQFSKWGNSLALRIPAVALADIGATEGMAADLVIEGGKLVVIRAPLDQSGSRISQARAALERSRNPHCEAINRISYDTASTHAALYVRRAPGRHHARQPA